MRYNPEDVLVVVIFVIDELLTCLLLVYLQFQTLKMNQAQVCVTSIRRAWLLYPVLNKAYNKLCIMQYNKAWVFLCQ